MNSPNNRALDLKDLADLIRVAGKSGVLFFEIGDIKVQFERQTKVLSPRTTVLQTKGTAEMENIATEANDIRREIVDQEQLELDYIEDPAAFEQRLVENELTDARNQYQ